MTSDHDDRDEQWNKPRPATREIARKHIQEAREKLRKLEPKPEETVVITTDYVVRAKAILFAMIFLGFMACSATAYACGCATTTTSTSTTTAVVRHLAATTTSSSTTTTSTTPPPYAAADVLAGTDDDGATTVPQDDSIGRPPVVEAVTVTHQGPVVQLPRTGVDVTAAVMLGSVLLLSGLFVLRLHSRSESTSASVSEVV